MAQNAGTDTQHSEAGLQLQHLPPNVLDSISIRLDDPAALASTCRDMSAHLSADALLLEWAKAWAPPAKLGTAHRHPGYALLHWRRTHTMSTARLVQLLLRLEKAGTGCHAAAGPSPRVASAQQLLADGTSLAPLRALCALLPHARVLLLPYAAQAGHMALVHKLSQMATTCIMRVYWWGGIQADMPLLVPALRAAASNGRDAALQALLQVFDASRWASSAQQKSRVEMWLLEDAIRAGAAGCVATMLGRCSAALQQQPQLQQPLLVAAARVGDAAVMQALIDANVGQPGELNVVFKALQHGHVQLLPLLRPATTADDALDMADLMCSAASSFGGRDAGEQQRLQQLSMLPAAMWAVRDQNNVRNCWRSALEGALRCNSVATLEEIWAQFSAPQYRGILACSMLTALAVFKGRDDSSAARWVVRNALPGLAHAQQEDVEAAAEAVFRHGHIELLAAMVKAGALAGAFVARLQQSAVPKVSQLLHCVRRGDVGGVREALSSVGAGGLSARVSKDALECAVNITDPEAAEAVVRALAPKLDAAKFSWLDDNALCVHEGRLLRALCMEAPALRRLILVGSNRVADKRTLCCICRGDVGAAVWAICSPFQQQPTALSDARWLAAPPRDIADHGPLLGLTALLHELAALPASADWDGLGGEGGKRREGVPAGARQLTGAFLSMVMEAGMPDLLHGLLVYVDAWGVVQEAGGGGRGN